MESVLDRKAFEEASYFSVLIRKALMCAVDKDNVDYKLLYTSDPAMSAETHEHVVSCSGAEGLIMSGLEFARNNNVYIKDIVRLTDDAPSGIVYALRVHVYRDHSGDCTNGGVSSRFEELLMFHPEGYVEVDLNDIPENFVVLEKRILFHEEADFIRPLCDVPSGMVGWMSGGNIAYTSDSRFCRHPLLIHDRAERPM